MLASDRAVQIKLIIMYAIGVIVMSALLFTIFHKYHKWLGMKSIFLLAMTLTMIMILTIVIQLPS